jgi:CO/xanthine dehydrogenase Mo-binding subunit
VVDTPEPTPETDTVAEGGKSPDLKFSQRQPHRMSCASGAERFGWSKRSVLKPGRMREGQWLIGMGVAAGLAATTW